MRLKLLAIGTLFVLGLPAIGTGDDDIALRKFHPWGRFHVGSWNRLRVVTETVEPDGRVSATSVIDTKSTLVELRLETFSLRIESTAEVGGKKMPPLVRIVKQGYADEGVEDQLTFSDSDSSAVSIDGKKIECAAQEVEVVGGGQRRITMVRYADNIAPFVLERKTTATDLISKARTLESDYSIVELNVPHSILGVLRNTARTRQVLRNPRGGTSTVSLVSADVPGELVSQTAEKTDDHQRVTHRSQVELTNFYAAPAPQAGDPDSGTRVPRRYHKKSRHDRR